MTTPIILSLGMGVDSVALLVRWILHPETRRRPDGRPFALADLIVVTAMTGDEYARTGHLMTTYVLPLLREHHIRYVQVCRAGQSDSTGYVVLDDSRHPRRMIMRGPWRLSDEMATNGTVPQVASKRRWCSARAKAAPIEGWIADNIRDGYVHVVGYAVEEANRAERAESFTQTIDTMYPLILWGWDRDRCDRYLLAWCGEPWQRSCCGYCPFQSGKAGLDQMLDRWRADPPAAIQALTIEWTALSLNPRAALFGKRTARSIALTHGLTDVVAAADAEIAALPWAAYRIRRIYRPTPDDRMVKTRNVWRSVRLDETGTSTDMRALVRGHDGAAVDPLGIARAYTRQARPPYPAVDDYLVAAPAGVADKERKGFVTAWRNLTGELLPTAPAHLTVDEQLAMVFDDLAELLGV